VSRVLRYPRVQRIHGIGEEKIDEYLRLLQMGSLMVAVPSDEVETVVPNDPKDDPIVATAVAAKAEVLCTLDRHLHQESVLNYCGGRSIEVVTRPIGPGASMTP
jgi:predicted nucleic acid-binding protein